MGRSQEKGIQEIIELVREKSIHDLRKIFLLSEVDLLTEKTDIPLALDAEEEAENLHLKRRRKILSPTKITELLIKNAVPFEYWDLLRRMINKFIETGNEKIEAKSFVSESLKPEIENNCNGTFEEIVTFYINNTERDIMIDDEVVVLIEF